MIFVPIKNSERETPKIQKYIHMHFLIFSTNNIHGINSTNNQFVILNIINITRIYTNTDTFNIENQQITTPLTEKRFYIMK